jgi:hypothetical protein
MRKSLIIIILITPYILYSQESIKKVKVDFIDSGNIQKLDSIGLVNPSTLGDSTFLQIKNGYVDIPTNFKDSINIIVYYNGSSKEIICRDFISGIEEDDFESWTFGIDRPPYSDEFIKHFPYYSLLPKILYWMKEYDEYSDVYYYPFNEDLYIIEDAKQAELFIIEEEEELQ